jgi:hypothetical protein
MESTAAPVGGGFVVAATTAAVDTNHNYGGE